MYLFQISGKGIPAALSGNCQCARVPSQLIPTTERITSLYEQMGGHLTYPRDFGKDPLESQELLQQERHQKFKQYFPKFEDIFTSIMSGNDVHFRSAVRYHIDLTCALTTSFNIN